MSTSDFSIFATIDSVTSFRDPDLPAKLRHWLRNELSSQHHARLEQAGHPAAQLDVALVFTDIEADSVPFPPREAPPQSDELPPGILAELLQVRPGPCVPPVLDSVVNDRAMSNAFLLIGGPGQGKSTIVQFLCQIHRAAVLKEVLDAAKDELVEFHKTITRSITFRLEADRLPSPNHLCLPAQVSLPALAAWMVRQNVPPDQAVIGFLCEQIGKAQVSKTTSIPADDMVALIDLVPWLISFDGLDEVPVSGGKEFVVKAVESFLRRLRAQQADVVLLVTTRPHGYRDELSTELAPRYLRPLSTTRALTYALRLVVCRYRSDKQRQDKILERLQQAAREPLTARLMSSPLQVTIMAALVDRIGRPPHQRWRLFRDYYQVVYEREIERPDSSAAQLLRDHRTHIEEIHYHVGLTLQVESERRRGMRALLTARQLERLIEARLKQDEFSAPKRRELAQEIRRVATERLVFLVGLEEDGYGFELHALQELMAAEALMSGNDDDIKRRLRAIAGPNFWVNVFLFAVGKIFAERRHLRDAVVALCEQLNEDPGDPLASDTLAGSYAALSILEDDSVDAPKHANQLARLAIQLIDQPPPTTVLARLAQLDEPMQDMLRDALSGDWSTDATAASPLGRWVMLAELIASGCDWARSVAESHWPTDPDAQHAVASTIYNNVQTSLVWIAETVATHLNTFTPQRIEQYERTWIAKTFYLGSSLIPFTLLPTPFLYPRTLGQGDSLSLQILSHPISSPFPFVQDWVDKAMGDPEEVPGSWQPWFSARRFRQQPDPETLASELDRIGERCDRETWQYWSDKVPWPLGGLLAFADTPADLASLASQARSGDFGDFAQWQATEKPWFTPGQDQNTRPSTSIDDLLATAEAWPFLALVAHPVSPTRFDSATDDWWSVIEAYRAEQSPRRQRFLARLIVEGIAADRSTPALAVSDSQRDVVRRLARHTEPEFWNALLQHDTRRMSKVGLALYLLAGASEGEYPRWLAAAETWVEEQPFRSFDLRDTDTRVVETLVATYRREPARLGLLRILAQLAAHGHKVELPPELLHRDRFHDDERQFDAALLRWASGRGTAAEFDRWLHRLVENRGAVLSWSHRYLLLNVLRRQTTHLTPAFCEHGLRRLREYAPPDDWEYPRDLHVFMAWMVASRASGLDHKPFWYQLGLDAPSPEDVLGTPYSVEVNAPHKTSTQSDNSPAIERIGIRNVRLFEALDLNIQGPMNDANDGRWLVLLGENGVGKSTILRSLALALAEPNIAHALLGSSAAPFLRTGEDEAAIEVTVHGVPFSTRILAEQDSERVDLEKNGAPRPLLFAYGCARGSAIGGADRAVSYTPMGYLSTLFDESEALISADTWLKLLQLDALKHGRRHAQIYETVIDTLCGLLPGVTDIQADGTSVWLSGAAVGERVPLTGLSDGYITTIGWVCDLLARWLHRADKRGEPIEPGFNEHMRGLVLVDEIDLHLHPRWQRDVIHIVRSAFPKMSFVVTTHNPLTLLGTRDGEVVVLKRDRETRRVQGHSLDVPKGIRADQLLTGEWFGLASTLDPDTLTLLEQHRQLLRDGVPASRPERKQVDDKLNERLDGFPGTTLEQLSRQVAAELLDESYPERTPEEKAILRDEFKRMLAERHRQRGS